MKSLSRINKITVIAVLLFFVFTIFVNVGLAQDNGNGGILPKPSNDNCPPNYKGDNCGGYTLDDFIRLAVNASNWMLGIVGSLALLFFVYGGFMMIISAGNTERSGKAKTILTNAIIGLVIVFTSWLIIEFVVRSLGYKEEWNRVAVSQQREYKANQVKTSLQGSLVQSSFNINNVPDIRNMSEQNFNLWVESQGVDTSSSLYQFYSNDIYDIGQKIINKEITSSQELYNNLPTTAKFLLDREEVNQAWGEIESQLN